MEMTKETMTKEAREALADPTTSRWFGRVEDNLQAITRALSIAQTQLSVFFEPALEVPEVKVIDDAIETAMKALNALDEADAVEDLWRLIREAQRSR